MTRGGFAALDEELKQLKSVERPAIIRAIAEAREHGDLSENAEYDAAKERQGFIEGRERIAKTLNARSFSQGLIDRRSQSNRAIFSGMVIVDLQVTDAFEVQIHPAVKRKCRQHVIEEPDSG